MTNTERIEVENQLSAAQAKLHYYRTEIRRNASSIDANDANNQIAYLETKIDGLQALYNNIKSK